MKKIINIVGSLLFLGTLLTGCNTDRFPKGSIDGIDNSYSTMEQASFWDNGLYSSFRARQYGQYVYVAEQQADMINATADFGNNGGNPHSWNNFTSTDYDLRDIWDGYYSGINNANIVIEKIAALRKTFDATTEDGQNNIVQSNIYEANARFVRAYYYSELTKRYGTPFNSATQDTDLSVPLVLTYDYKALPSRATNKQMYDQIAEDLKFAKGVYGSIKSKIKGDGKFSLDACTALEARVALEKKDYATALKVAKELISTNRYPLVKSADELFDMWRNDKSTEDILMMSVSRPDELSSSAGSYFSALSAYSYPYITPNWVPTQWVVESFDVADYRINAYFVRGNAHISYIGGRLYPIVPIVKFRGNPEYASSTDSPFFGAIPNGVQRPKVFRIAETYLIAAEAACKLGDDATASEYLNALKVSRGLAPVSTTGDALFEELKQERMKELAFEGFRLWDLRRWNMPMERHDPQFVRALAKGTGSVPYYELKIEATHPKFVWGIPANDINVNPNLKGHQNPGW